MSDYLASAIGGTSMAKSPQVAQNQPIEATQVENNESAFVWEADDFSRLNRFLILGTEGGSYYQSESNLTVENLTFLVDFITSSPENARRVADRTLEVSVNGLALRQSATLMTWALLLAHADDTTKAFVTSHTSDVIRTGTMAMQLAKYVDLVTGWGPAKRRAVASFYESRDARNIAYQVAKYGSRHGWSHRDLLRKTHPSGSADGVTAVYDAICGRIDPISLEEIIGQNALTGTARAAKASNVKELKSIISDYNLSWEMIPTEALNDKNVWDDLVPNLGYSALLRNLNRLTNNGWLAPASTNRTWIMDKLTDQDFITKSRIHPFAIYMAARTYQSGRGMRGSNAWSPVTGISDALDDAFLKAFTNVEPTNLRILLALDISGSMTIPVLPGVSAMEASAALALITLRTEPNVETMAFSSRNSQTGTGRGYRSSGFTKLNLSGKTTIDSVYKVFEDESRHMTGTDCALPFLWAKEKGHEFDAFALYTDSETWAGDVHPSVALNQYRKTSGIRARSAVVAMIANRFTIADPKDPAMLDVVGLSADLPTVLSEFWKGF